jgi:hypothetical protein
LLVGFGYGNVIVNGVGKMKTRVELAAAGVALVSEFCAHNKLREPEMRLELQRWRVRACGYYRPHMIAVCVPMCATPGTVARQWSWPSYVIDRTPFGVVQHELGHAVDILRSVHKDRYRGDYSQRLRAESGEPKITNYAPDDGEWFAEMFRIFVTNPDLLYHCRPKTFTLIRSDFKPVVSARWDHVLFSQHEAPERYRKAAENKFSI